MATVNVKQCYKCGAWLPIEYFKSIEGTELEICVYCRRREKYNLEHKAAADASKGINVSSKSINKLLECFLENGNVLINKKTFNKHRGFIDVSLSKKGIEYQAEEYGNCYILKRRCSNER